MALRPARTYGLLQNVDTSTRSVQVVASTRQAIPTWIPVNDGQSFELVPLVIRSWNLERFKAYAPVLWCHDSRQAPIGDARDIEQAEGELRMRIFFAAPSINPEGDLRFRQIGANLVRGVSVGFDTFAGVDTVGELPDGQIVVFRDGAVLNEVSVVSVQADWGALTPAEGLEEQRQIASFQTRALEGWRVQPYAGKKKKPSPEDVSAAGRTLAGARRSKVTLDANESLYFDAGSRLQRGERTGAGGLRAPANITRCGVLRYRLPNGSIRRELRTPDEVFNPESLATLRSVPLTIGHPRTADGFVDPTNAQQHKVGHVESAAPSGRFVAGSVIVDTAEALQGVESGDLGELSPGYVALRDFTPGVWEGEQYDCVQRRIRYNHVALLPPGRGRSGPDVALRLDADDAVCVEEEEKEVMKIIVDGIEFEFGSREHLAAIERGHEKKIQELTAAHKITLDAKDTELKTVTSERDTLKGNLATKTEELTKLQKTFDEANAPAAVEKRVEERSNLVVVGRSVIGEKFDPKGKTNRALMVEVVKAEHPTFDAKDTDSEDFIRGRYEPIAERTLAKAQNGINQALKHVPRAGGPITRDSRDPVTPAAPAAPVTPRWQRPLTASK